MLGLGTALGIVLATPAAAQDVGAEASEPDGEILVTARRIEYEADVDLRAVRAGDDGHGRHLHLGPEAAEAVDAVTARAVLVD